MKAAGVEVQPEGGTRHAGLDRVTVAGRFAFAFVREPLSFYGSWWHHCRVIDPSWRSRASSFIDAPHIYFINLPFERYVEACLAHQPGFVSNLYREFVGPPEAEIAFVGRYERLVDDLVMALRLAGQDFDEGALRCVPAQNTSGSHVEATPELLARIREVEHEVYERFYTSRIEALPS